MLSFFQFHLARVTLIGGFLVLFLGIAGPMFAQDSVSNSDEHQVISEQSKSTDSESQDNWMERTDTWFGENLVQPVSKVLFYDFRSGPWTDTDGLKHEGWLKASVPFVVIWLMAGAVFLTFRMMFINLRGFGHAIRVTRGDYDDPEDAGEVTHFQALSSALSATVGLGNIGGVAMAVGIGGPGAIFWMVVAGFFGMTSKFTECTLAQMYRKVNPDGHVSGGPMRYLKDGLAEMRLSRLGVVLSLSFAVLCFGASFGGGCAYQVSQSQLVVLGAIQKACSLEANSLEQYRWIYGALMAVMVGIVIIGGIQRIAATAEKVVPLMCIVYVGASITILVMNASQILPAFQKIFSSAWDTQSAYGGIIGAAIVGISRAAFSNEAGVGSAAIAHSAAKTKYPVREGLVSLLGPFIDTIIICTMTGLVIIITGVCDDPLNAEIIKANEGAALTSAAFGNTVYWFPYLLAVAVFLFAYSTMISWSYYGERCATFLFGQRVSIPYRLLFVICVFLGSVIKAANIFEFSIMMVLAMAVPNILGLYLLSGKVKQALDKYWKTFKQSDFQIDSEQ